MREKEDFRNNLVRLDEKFPNKEMLNLTDVSRFLGIDIRTCKKMIKNKIVNGYISKTTLARIIS